MQIQRSFRFTNKEKQFVIKLWPCSFLKNNESEAGDTEIKNWELNLKLDANQAKKICICSNVLLHTPKITDTEIPVGLATPEEITPLKS